MGHPEDCRAMPIPVMFALLRERIMEWGNISQLARETGYTREGISRALKAGNMRLKMFWDIAKKVDFHWCIQVKASPDTQPSTKENK